MNVAYANTGKEKNQHCSAMGKCAVASTPLLDLCSEWMAV